MIMAAARIEGGEILPSVWRRFAEKNTAFVSASIPGIMEKLSGFSGMAGPKEM